MKDSLEEIKERLERATPGPWRYGGYIRGKDKFNSQDFVVSETAKVRCRGEEEEKLVCLSPNYESKGFSNGENDMVFIANAPSDIEWLIEEVERLQKAINRIENIIEKRRL